MTRCQFESENYRFSLYSFEIKEEFKTPGGISELVETWETLTGYRVTRIIETDKTGRPHDLHHPKLQNFAHDTDWQKLGIYKFNDAFCERILFQEDKNPKKAEVLTAAARFFLFQGKPIEKIFQINMIAGEDARIRKLRKGGPAQRRPVLPHEQFETSPIEEELEKGLKAGNLPYQRQQEVFRDGVLVAVADFLIENPLIAIFCDGYQFHSDKFAVLKDRKQDRVLQALGYTVLRFTGSEIMGHRDDCINEIRSLWEKGRKNK